MAANLNRVFLVGNLTRDPELRYIPSGTAVANFTLAINHVYKDNTGEKKEDVSFIRVVVWGRIAEICGEYLVKGRSVLVEGRLRSRTWDGQDGQKRSVVEVIASSVQFLGPKDRKIQSAGPSENGSNRNFSEKEESVESIDVDAADMNAAGDTPF